jgi:cytochrome c nitrite reductase small subunit
MKPHVVSIVVAALIGAILGVGFYTFIYAKGYSYLASDSAACTNCHVMRGYYDGWVKSSHHAAATCNDCHTPNNAVAKVATKTSNGFFHSFAFTSGRFPDAIQIKSGNQEVTETACRRCHQDLNQVVNGPHAHGTGLSCVHCHASVGHSEAMAFAPIALVEGKN